MEELVLISGFGKRPELADVDGYGDCDTAVEALSCAVFIQCLRLDSENLVFYAVRWSGDSGPDMANGSRCCELEFRPMLLPALYSYSMPPRPIEQHSRTTIWTNHSVQILHFPLL